MKCKTIKFLTAGAASLTAALLCAGLVNAGAKIGVFAETAQGEQNETPYTTGEAIASFKLDEKASVRKTDNPGIRFATQISAADKIAGAEYGTLVIPKHLLGENELTIENANAQKIVTKIWLNEEETAYYSALTGIDEKYYNTPLIARSYMKTAENVVHYTNIAERSLGYVAVMALDGGEESNLIEGIAAKTEEKFNLSATALKLNSEKTEETLTATASVGGIAYTPEITWVSSAENVASVDNNGAVQALKEGETTITAKFMLNGKEKSAECKVTVKDEIELVISGGGDVYLNSADGEKTRTLNVDTFKINGKDADKSLITWSATETTYNYVENKALLWKTKTLSHVTVVNGVVTGVNGGKTTVSAEYNTQFGKATATQEVTVITRVLTSTDANTKGNKYIDGIPDYSRYGELSRLFTYMNYDPFGYYVLGEEITVSDSMIYTVGNGTNKGTIGGSETPVTNLNTYHAAVPYFYGTLDGRGHTLNNLKIKSNAAAYGTGNNLNQSYTSAIFGVLTGKIKDISVEYIDETSTNTTEFSSRPFIYFMNGGTVENAYIAWRKADYKMTAYPDLYHAYPHALILQARKSTVTNLIVNVIVTDESTVPENFAYCGIIGYREFGTMENCYLINNKMQKLVSTGTAPVNCSRYDDGAAFLAGVTALNETDGWCKYWKIENGTLKFGNNVLISSEPSAE